MRRFASCIVTALALITAFLAFMPSEADAQSAVVIRDIVVNSNIESTDQLIINLCGLKVGSALSRENVAAAIQYIWKTGVCSDISISQEPMEGGARVCRIKL